MLGRRARSEIYAGVLIGLVSFGVYANTLSHGLVYDDAKQILANSWIRDVRHLVDIMTHDVWGFWSERGASSYYRPLMHVVNMMVYHAFGLAPWAYHLVNVLLHAGTSVLVFLLVGRIHGGSSETPCWILPFIAALLFSTHPIHTEAVAWAGGLPDLSFSFFYLLSFLLFLRSTGDDPDSPVLYVLSLSAFALALLAKEPALTLPLMLVAYDYSFRRVRFRKCLKKQLPFLVVAGVYLAVRFSVLGGVMLPRGDLPLARWLPDALGLFGRYLGKLLLPIQLNAYHPAFPAKSFFELTALIGLGSTVIFTALLYISLNRSRIAFLSLMFMVVPLLPALYLPGIGGTPFAERYLYLPSLGFAVLLALAIARLARPLRHGARIALATATLVALLYSGATLVRNGVWADDFQLWSDTVRKSPASGVPHNNLGRAYFSRGDIEKAIDQYRIALRLNPDHAEAHNNLGAALATESQFDEAESEFLTALSLKRDYSDAHNNLGILYGSLGNVELALSHFSSALRIRPDFPDAHHNIGVAYLDDGELDLAIEHFQSALKLDPAAARTHLLLANAYEIKGLEEEARKHRMQARALSGGPSER